MSMTSGPATKEQVLTALTALYKGADNLARVQANGWLENFQKTREAWTVSDQIIQDPSVGLEERVFAAQTFRNKIIYDVAQLDVAARASLRDSLFSLLRQYQEGPSALSTQLSLAFVDLAIQMPEWVDVIPEVRAVFGTDAAGARTLLNLLTLLPEELTMNTRIPLSDEEFQVRSAELLERNAEEVLGLLLLFLQNLTGDAKGQEGVFQCLLAWLHTGHLGMTRVGATAVVEGAFEALHSEALFDVAADLVVCMLKETREVEEYPEVVGRIANLLRGVHTRLIGLGGRIPRIIDASTGAYIGTGGEHPVSGGGNVEVEGDDEDDEHEEERRGLCRILSHAGESYAPLISQHPETFAHLAEALLTCAQQADLECVGMTFYFWETLASLLTSTTRGEESLPRYVPLFERLEDTMIRHLQYPSGSGPEGSGPTGSGAGWTSEERDAFRDFRHRMGDTLKDCSSVLGTEGALTRPLHLLQGALRRYTEASGTRGWEEVEAPLFSLRALGERVPPKEEVVMPEIMALLGQLPPHPKLRYAATLVIGRYTEWTAAHPALLPYQLTFISGGFGAEAGGSEEVVQAAAMALKYLCRDCRHLLVGTLEELHPFYVRVSQHLTLEDLADVTEALAHVIGAIPEPDRLLQALRTFTLPSLQELERLSLAPEGGDEVAHAAEAALHLDRLGQFIRYVRPHVPEGSPHPGLPLITATLPVLSTLLERYGADPTFSESITLAYRHIMEGYGPHLLPYLPALLGAFGEAYARTGLSAYIWVGRRAAWVYARGEGAALVGGFVDGMSGVVMKRVEASAQVNPGMGDMTDGIDEYFRLLLAFQEAQPALAIRSPLLPAVFACAMQCLRVEQAYAGRAVIDYLRDLFALGLPPLPGRSGPSGELAEVAARVQGLILGATPGLEARLFEVMTTTMNEDCLEDAAVLLEILLQVAPAEVMAGIGSVVRGMADDLAGPEIRERLLRDVHAAATREEWRRVRALQRDYIVRCRRRVLALRGATL